MKDNYIEKRERRQLCFLEVKADYVIMMSHAIDRYFSSADALVQVFDYMIVRQLLMFTASHTHMQHTQAQENKNTFIV